MTGSLYIIGTPIGNPDDLSLRAIRILRDVDVVAAEDPQRTQALFIRHGITTPLTSYQNDDKEEKIPVLIQRLREGRSVALVSDAGTPAVVDPGGLLIREALRRHIAVVPVPGPSALLAALSVSGLPGDAFVFAGLLPARQKARRAVLRALRQEQRTIVLFESPRRLPAALKAMRAALGNRRITLACNLTTRRERIIRGTIDGIVRRRSLTATDDEVTLVVEGKKAGG
jgi:16S rRNA (cytidine1402-2'-O)-methyltransferase